MTQLDETSWNLTQLDTAWQNLTKLNTTQHNLTQLNLRSYAQILCLLRDYTLVCETRLQISFFCWYNSDIALSLPWYAQKFGARSFCFSPISILLWDTFWMSILFWNTLWLSILFWNSLWLSILCFGEGNLNLTNYLVTAHGRLSWAV